MGWRISSTLDHNNELQNKLNENLDIKNPELKFVKPPVSYSPTSSKFNNVSTKTTAKVKASKTKIVSGKIASAFIVTNLNGKTVYKKIRVSQKGEYVEPFTFKMEKIFRHDDNGNDAMSAFLVLVDKKGNSLSKMIYIIPTFKAVSKYDFSKIGVLYTGSRRMFPKNDNVRIKDISDAIDEDSFNNSIDEETKKINSKLSNTNLSHIDSGIKADQVLKEHHKIIKYLKDNYIIN
ncbi:hypothetical protein [Fructilactobacillus cliffordii]|uniref:Uncharacterized protein n=1 Tax=Fructilactobacillus cliffordii TaxID=2940299 RepID=A0A9Q9E2P0_9LACO|nr:hypothetical protein [Fructilactobacillus cliffordii]USS88957.1 hypothetical protein M3M40_05580 [Fructilactobacillus cliffordii]